jgi:hypothetical protein
MDEEPATPEPWTQRRRTLKADTPDVAVALEVVVQISYGAAHNEGF